jgi:hypothetical protein
LVEDNGESFPVKAHAEDDRLIIEGPAGQIEASPDTEPSEPSLKSAIRRDSSSTARPGSHFTPQ